MYDGLPDDYNEQLQLVGQELMNGSLDKVGAVIRLVRAGWAHEEADAVVAEIVEQVETTRKLLRDAARVLDDSPSGQARASARLREAGMSAFDADQLVQQLNQQRHVAVGRVRDVLRAIRQGKLGRLQAAEQLTHRGMESHLSSTIIDVYTDSATHWSLEWLRLSIVLTVGAILTSTAVGYFLWSEMASWLGVAVAVFLAIPIVVLGWSISNFRFWRDWSMIHEGQRECPRNCSPMVMLSQGKGRHSTILTAMEWGLGRETATELVRRRADLNVKVYMWITLSGALFITLALSSAILSLFKVPGEFLSMGIVDSIMAAVGGILAYRGIAGWQCFAKK
ncbi:MAG: hypothetical protein U0796_18080 [Gemmatales bacterium]